MRLVVAVTSAGSERGVGRAGLTINVVINGGGLGKLGDVDVTVGVEIELLIAGPEGAWTGLPKLKHLGPGFSAVRGLPDGSALGGSPAFGEGDDGNVARMQRVYGDAGLGVGEVAGIQGIGGDVAKE